MAVANGDIEEGEQPVVQSRYSIVKAAAARAKQIIDARSIQERIAKNPDKENPLVMTKEEKKKIKLGEELIDNAQDIKPLSVAVAEMYAGKVKIVGSGGESSQQ